jgi:hypothetical protein
VLEGHRGSFITLPRHAADFILNRTPRVRCARRPPCGGRASEPFRVIASIVRPDRRAGNRRTGVRQSTFSGCRAQEIVAKLAHGRTLAGFRFEELLDVEGRSKRIAHRLLARPDLQGGGKGVPR